MLKKMLRLNRKQKLNTLNKSTISTKKLLKRPTPKTPSLKPEDKLQSKMSSLMVDKTKSLLLTKQIQLQLLQPPLPPLLQQRPRKKLFFKIQKIPIKQKLSLWKQFLKPPRHKEPSKLPAIKTLPLLKINISIKLRTRRTPLELIERFKLMEDSFTIHQLGINITMLLRNHLLPKRKKRRKKEETKLSHSPHLNLTNKKLIP